MSERSYIDGILSTHFNECSIAAADAARLADSHVTEKTPTLEAVQAIGPYVTEGMEEFNIYSVQNILFEHEAVADTQVRLALATHPKIPDMPITLCAIFNQGTMLPLASFEKRAQGQCSYVQLGQEIEEDKLIVTPNAPRADYVEEIRALLSQALPRAGFKQIKSLLESEIHTYRDQIDIALAPTVCRLAEAYFAAEHKAKTENIRLLNTDTSGLNKYLVTGLTVVTANDAEETPSPRTVKLLLARELRQQEQEVIKPKRFGRQKVTTEVIEVPVGSLKLIASVRGNIGLTLAHFASSGVVTLSSCEDCPDEETLRNLIKVLSPDSKEHRRALSRAVDVYSSARMLGYSVCLDEDLPQQLYGLRTKSRDEYSRFGGSPFSTIDPQGLSYDDFKKALSKHDWRLPKELTSALKSTTETDMQTLFASLQIDERFDTLLGPGRSPAEELILTLGNLVTKGQAQFEGVLKDKKAGKTRTDVDTTVAITNGNHQFRVAITGRPSSLEGFDPVTLFDQTLHLDRPNTLLEDTVNEIAEVVGTICIKQQIEKQ